MALWGDDVTWKFYIFSQNIFHKNHICQLWDSEHKEVTSKSQVDYNWNTMKLQVKHKEITTGSQVDYN